jgi:hypothetical protein
MGRQWVLKFAVDDATDQVKHIINLLPDDLGGFPLYWEEQN